MDSLKVTIAEAQANLSALLARVEAGETVTITRDGQPIASLTVPAPEAPPAEDPPIPQWLLDLDEFRKTMPPARLPAGEMLRELRDNERY
jgi:antitoxin (DNA-binding transcriptional repressor) of toxin-antitoxin stability system